VLNHLFVEHEPDEAVATSCPAGGGALE
jgi:hypothetical protein